MLFSYFKKTLSAVPFYTAEHPDSVNSFPSVVLPFPKFGFINLNFYSWTSDLLIVSLDYFYADFSSNLTPVNNGVLTPNLQFSSNKF